MGVGLISDAAQAGTSGTPRASAHHMTQVDLFPMNGGLHAWFATHVTRDQ